MAEIVWKGVIWKAAYGQLSIRELLTVLKGFGSMETLRFEKTGCFRGDLSLSLTSDGVKEVTLHHLEVLGPRRQGQGRGALVFLRRIFRGPIHVEDPEIFDVDGMHSRSQAFWSRMLRDGVVDSVNSDIFEVNELSSYGGKGKLGQPTLQKHD